MTFHTASGALRVTRSNDHYVMDFPARPTEPFQASARGGEVLCRLLGERVLLEGGCVFYLEGEVEI